MCIRMLLHSATRWQLFDFWYFITDTGKSQPPVDRVGLPLNSAGSIAFGQIFYLSDSNQIEIMLNAVL